MHPAAQPKHKIKDEIMSNLRQLQYLFNGWGEENEEENDENEEDDYDEFKKIKY